MEPYYDSWIEQPAHADVACVRCHFPPGLAGTVRGKLEGLVQVVNYLSSSYTRRRPWAEIEDASCLQSGCHDTRLLVGQVDYQGVVFDHTHHIGEMRRGKDLRCTSCHSQIVQGDHMVVTNTTCFLCHFKKGDEVEPEEFARLSDCETCHNWDRDVVVDSVNVPQGHAESGTASAGIIPVHGNESNAIAAAAPDSDRDLPSIRLFHQDLIARGVQCNQCHSSTIVGDGFVPRENCVSCHSDPERLERFDDTELLHRMHISENKIECIRCHLTVQHKIQQPTIEDQLDCATCHRDTHREQVMLFTGNVPSGQGTPSPMFDAGLDCAGCHVFHGDLIGPEGERIARPQSCESCHGPGYDRLLRQWQRSAQISLIDFGDAITATERAVLQAGPSASEEVESHLQRAKQILHLATVGKPVHNVTFYDELLRVGYGDLREAVDKSDADMALPEYRSTTLVPGECANCHTGIERLESNFRGLQFSHDVHVAAQQLECSTCHSNVIRHGQVTLSQSECNSCHHSPQIENACASCHVESAEIYAGTYMGQDLPDYMFEEDVTCDDCHGGPGSVARPEPSICLDCHDDGYDDDARDWQTEVAELTGEIRRALATGVDIDADVRERATRIVADVEKAGAGGIHNYELSVELLVAVRDNLKPADDREPPASSGAAAGAAATAAGGETRTGEEAAAARDQAESAAVEAADQETVPDEPKVYVIAEKMPILIDGLEGLLSRIVYPEEALSKEIEGQVLVRFIVDEEGRVVDPVVLRGIGGGCDEEAVRAIETAQFVPGMQQGQPVRVTMTLPVLFKLD
jgi:TonB family protein